MTLAALALDLSQLDLNGVSIFLGSSSGNHQVDGAFSDESMHFPQERRFTDDKEEQYGVPWVRAGTWRRPNGKPPLKGSGLPDRER